jgi:Phage tail protein
MDIKIIRKDGTEYLLSEKDIKTLDFIVDSPTPRHNFEYLQGRDSIVDMGSNYEGRNINVKLMLLAYDSIDFALLRNEVYRLFDSREAFYIVDMREPGKRWEVKADVITPDQITDNRGKMDIRLTSLSAYAESIGTTLDDKTFDEEVWQVGQGVTLEPTQYSHTASNFSVYNAAEGVNIDPRFVPLKITFKGPSTNLKITNNTTGEFWQYTGSTVANDTVILDGVFSTKNGASIFGNTNRKLIKLLPGNNDFTVTGTTGAFTITFEFRFYML